MFKRIKKIFSCAVVTLMILMLGITSAYAADGAPKIFLNEVEIQCEQSPIATSRGYVLVPVEKVAKAMGCDFEWQEANKTAIVKNRLITAVITAGNPYILLSSNIDTKDSLYLTKLFFTPQFINGNLFVSAGAFEGMLDAIVTVNSDENRVDITYSYPTVNSVITNARAYYRNADIIGYLEIGSDMNNLVTQTSDNTFYLTHNLQKATDRNGAIFMDYENRLLNSTYDHNTVIYGNNMNSGAMFAHLKNFLNETYARQYKYIRFNTLYDRRVYEVFSVFVTNANTNFNQVVFKPNAPYINMLNEAVSRSIFKMDAEVSISDNLLTLSTHYSSNPQDTWLVVCAKLISQEPYVQ